jgi:regulator of cell morphogenesis and NO signaling
MTQDWDQARAELDAWMEKPLTELVQHILKRYHRETRLGMAELENLAEESASMDGHRIPVLLAIRDEVDLFCTEMRAHLKMEEVTLFPAILAKDQGREVDVKAELQDPIELFEDEHNAAAGLLQRIRKLTNNFVPPPDAAEAQASLYKACEDLADSLVQHIYLENEVLFKRMPK